MNFKANPTKVIVAIILAFVVMFLFSGFLCSGSSYCLPSFEIFTELFSAAGIFVLIPLIVIFAFIYVLWSLIKKKK